MLVIINITYVFHVVLDAVLLQVGRCLCSVKPLCGVQVGFLKVVPVNLQFVLWIRTQVHWWDRRTQTVTESAVFCFFLTPLLDIYSRTVEVRVNLMDRFEITIMSIFLLVPIYVSTHISKKVFFSVFR